ncbi:MAG TPA: BTAD domain-containing putative transcriptional regulator [Mycobacteriales bacterium]|nr:BTAD domain-containing putative transcriptional regulator [Mycobacteriales bacterium]
MSTASVLVVDDNPANIRLLEAVLSAHGYNVRAAENGPTGLQMIADDPPDLVILDVQMPGMNGHEVCRRIREDEASAMLPVIVVTASGNEEKLSALDAGADDFVARPFDQAELLARVRSLLRIKAYQDTIGGQAAELASWNRLLEEQVQEQVVEVERLQRLRRFLSAHVADAVLGSDEALLEPHRREVAVVHCQLRGFTAFAAESEPEAVLRALQDFHRLVGEVVTTHGATLGSFAGDRVVFFIGDPVPATDPVRSAVTAAIDLREAVNALVEEMSEPRDLALACGMSFGYATLGVIGYEGRLDYSAIGPVVDLARMICDAAASGEVRCGPNVATMSKQYAVVEDRGVVDLAAHLPPTGTWSILGLRAGATLQGDEPELDIRLLGPLEVRYRGADVPIRAARVRRLLGLLLLSRGRVVSIDRLVDEVWDNDPPDSALAALRVHVSRLRKMLAAAGLENLLVTRPTGYLLELADGSVDADRFERAVTTAREVLEAGDPRRAAEIFRSALSMWRGPALSGIATSTYVAGEAARLEEERLNALEDCISAEISGGNARDVLGELEALTVEHPLRERLWSLRMLALYRSGRQADALECYQVLRRQLDDDLGLEPSAEVARLHQEMLAQSPSLMGDVSRT